MSNTKDRILDTMQALIQTRGYSAVSYQDIADELGIRKASIHYHYATKSDLGVAVIERYEQAFTALLVDAKSNGFGPWRLLEVYMKPFLEFGSTPDKICLCGALAGEFLALPKEMQESVTLFFEQQQSWLEKLLRSGRKTGEFDFSGSARRQASLIFSALQGALLIKRSNGSAGQLHDVIAEIKVRLKPARKNS